MPWLRFRKCRKPSPGARRAAGPWVYCYADPASPALRGAMYALVGGKREVQVARYVRRPRGLADAPFYMERGLEFFLEKQR